MIDSFLGAAALIAIFTGAAAAALHSFNGDDDGPGIA